MDPAQAIVPIALTIVPVVALVHFRTVRRARLFTLKQRSQVGKAFHANCIWRPSQTVLLLPGIVIGHLAWEGQNPTLQSVSQGLLILAIWGMPMVRTGAACGGTIQGGHQLAHAHLGHARLWNCEPACEDHNRVQSSTWSFWFAWKQWGPISLAVYTWRNWIGTSRLGWMWVRGQL